MTWYLQKSNPDGLNGASTGKMNYSGARPVPLRSRRNKSVGAVYADSGVPIIISVLPKSARSCLVAPLERPLPESVWWRFPRFASPLREAF
jgi:hypothetical protein